MTWGVHGLYLIVAVGEGEVEAVEKRMQGAPPQWLNRIRKETPRSSASDGRLPRREIGPRRWSSRFVPNQRGRAIIEALGLGGVTHFAAVTGLDEVGFVSRSHLGRGGRRRRDLQGRQRQAACACRSGPDPARRHDRAWPPDATLGRAGRRFWRSWRYRPGGPQRILDGLREDESRLELNFRDDLLKPLGDVWCVYNSPGEGGLVVTGLTAVVRVDDAERLGQDPCEAPGCLRRADWPKQKSP